MNAPTELLPIETRDSVLLVDSRLIAQSLEIEHNDWLNNSIYKYQDEIENNFGLLRFETGAVKTEKSRGTKYSKYALLTEDQSFFIVTLSRNRPEVIAFKAKLVKSFSFARRALEKGANLNGLSKNGNVETDVETLKKLYYQNVQKQNDALVDIAAALKLLTQKPAPAGLVTIDENPQFAEIKERFHEHFVAKKPEQTFRQRTTKLVVYYCKQTGEMHRTAYAKIKQAFIAQTGLNFELGKGESFLAAAERLGHAEQYFNTAAQLFQLNPDYK